MSGDDNVLTVLLAVKQDQTNNIDIEYPAGLPAGQVVISGLYWPGNWPLTPEGNIKKIPVFGYRTSGFDYWDGNSLIVNITSRPQV